MMRISLLYEGNKKKIVQLNIQVISQKFSSVHENEPNVSAVENVKMRKALSRQEHFIFTRVIARFSIFSIFFRSVCRQH